jgi:hypothetical protein
MQTSVCRVLSRTSTIAPFGDAYEKIGTIQRRLAWPLHKDDTLFQSGRPTGLNIYFASNLFSNLFALGLCAEVLNSPCNLVCVFAITVLVFIVGVRCDMVCLRFRVFHASASNTHRIHSNVDISIKIIICTRCGTTYALIIVAPMLLMPVLNEHPRHRIYLFASDGSTWWWNHTAVDALRH